MTEQQQPSAPVFSILRLAGFLFGICVLTPMLFWRIGILQTLITAGFVAMDIALAVWSAMRLWLETKERAA